MKRNIVTMLLLSVCLWATAQNFDTSHSYVSERIYLNEEGTKYIDNVTYLDGFGRKLQEVQVKGSPNGTSDLVQPYSYGKMGRTERTFLPYAKANNNGAFVANPLNAAHWNAYGTADAAYAFTKTEYDNSPLNRVIRQTGPGSAWHTAGKAVTTFHDMNDTNEVRLYRVNKTSGLVYQDGHYRRGSLEKVTATDEDGHATETFTDNQGKTILTVVVNGEERLETYYVYDNRELLRWVLSPEASHRIASSIDTEALYKYAYYYEYDWLKRMTFKKLPGCEPVYMVYDKRDRLVLTQDGNMRALDSNRWNYTEYNTKNRPVESGEIVLSSVATHAQLIDSMMDSESVPSGTRTPLQYIRYDKYTANEHVTPYAFVAVPGYAEDYHRKTVGRVTATKTRVLGTDLWITSTVYYDSKCRPMQVVNNNLQGGISYLNYAYDFIGNIVKRQEKHGNDILESVYTYDDRSRLLNVHSTLNGEAQASLVYEYDELGRLARKRYGGIITESYAYNTRGWLVSKESDAFRMELHYESAQAGTEPLYSGNVSEWSWKQGDEGSQLYGFSYDGAGRLTETVHLLKNGSEWSPHNNGYTEKGITYDRNGNILTLQRTASGSTIDNQAYSYDGNRLSSLNGSSYEYDYNGNMTKDHANGLEFTYNSLNLLHQVKENGMVKATYTYLADGTKLAARTEASTDGFDYLGRFLYSVTDETPSLALANTTDGFLTDEGMVYALTDHLGSVRVLVDDEGEVLERNDYYPFGTRHPNINYASTSNRYLFGRMEMQDFSTNPTYDFGARMLDGKLGRWMTMDPKAEKYHSMTPYGYCGNNPISNIDWFGMDYWSTNDPGQIATFFDALKGGYIGYHDYSGWNYMTDNEFSSKLSYNDENNTYYWSESKIINGELTVIGRHLKKFGYNLGNAIVGATSFSAGEFADMITNSNATYRLMNSKGNFDFKYYSNGWKGNQYVATKNVAKVGKVLGNILSVSDLIQLVPITIKTAESLYNVNVIESAVNINDLFMNGVGPFSLPGAIVSLYWSIGGKELQQLYTEKIIMEQLKYGINPGLPTFQPYK